MSKRELCCQKWRPHSFCFFLWPRCYPEGNCDESAAINKKNAHLVSLGTSAATKCAYCIPYHISEAKRLGATKEEIKTAILIAADVMKMSTLFYGNEFDLEAFIAMLK